MTHRDDVARLEREFADAMQRMYSVGNGLARLRAELERPRRRAGTSRVGGRGAGDRRPWRGQPPGCAAALRRGAAGLAPRRRARSRPAAHGTVRLPGSPGTGARAR